MTSQVVLVQSLQPKGPETLGSWVGQKKNSEIQPELVCEFHSTTFWVPHPLGPWGRVKGQISLNLNY